MTKLDPEDTAKFEALQIESRAARMAVEVQHMAAVKHASDLMTRTAALWKEIYEKHGLDPSELWRYENGMLHKVEQPPATQMQEMTAERAAALGLNQAS